MTWEECEAHLAVEHQDLHRLRDLLDAGHDVECDHGDGWTLLRHAIDVEYDTHVQDGGPLSVSTTAVLLARGADPLRCCDGVPIAEEAAIVGHWLAAETMNVWINRSPDADGPDNRLHPRTG